MKAQGKSTPYGVQSRVIITAIPSSLVLDIDAYAFLP